MLYRMLQYNNSVLFEHLVIIVVVKRSQILPYAAHAAHVLSIHGPLWTGEKRGLGTQADGVIPKQTQF
jgi:hypothetical protein